MSIVHEEQLLLGSETDSDRNHANGRMDDFFPLYSINVALQLQRLTRISDELVSDYPSVLTPIAAHLFSKDHLEMVESK
jgi:hypothetical protein